jgi:transcription initiation factor TFIIIB Brf1 subunit/transcription initiation factor TFIIB
MSVYDLCDFRADCDQSRFCTSLALPSTVRLAAVHIARKAGELDLIAGFASTTTFAFIIIAVILVVTFTGRDVSKFV